jgi:hypothetical protein
MMDMKYLSGTYALNLDCRLQTTGDWHFSSMDWRAAPLWDTSDSVYGDFGIEVRDVPGRGSLPVADHIRALLDLLERGYYSSAQGMREDFICNEDYTPLVFDKVWELRRLPNWPHIDRLMGREYGCGWLDYKEGGPHDAAA